MKKENNIPSRRKFVIGVGILSLMAAIRLRFVPKKVVLACAPPHDKKTIRMLTQDGQLVEIDAEQLKGHGKKITDEELKTWVKKS